MEQYSVLMTVYKKDNPAYFRMSLDSMVMQTVTPTEIILITDGPITDELQQIIDNCNQFSRGLIKEIELAENVGLGTALKIGVSKCTYELIARMDADDISLPNRCAAQLQAFQDNQCLDIVGCSVKEFAGEPSNILGQRIVPTTNAEIYRFARLRDPFNHPTVMFRKSKVLSVGNYGDYRKNQDTDLWVKLLSKKAVCQNLEGDYFRFRFNEATYAKRKDWLNTRTLLTIRYKAWRSGFNTLLDLVIIAGGQLARYILPIGLQKVLYGLIKK